MPRHQPATRGRDRVQADVHGLQARRGGGDTRLPRHRHRLGRLVTAAQRLAEWTGTLTFEDIPAEVVEAAKLHLLDTIGCGLAAHSLGIATEGRTAMAELGGEPQASVIGLDAALPAANAAFANAMVCPGLAFNDS